MINATVKMSSQGQITIPRDIREIIGMVAGSELFMVANTEKPLGISMYPKPLKWVDTIAGIAEGAWGTDSKASTKYIRELRNEWDKRTVKQHAQRI